MNRNQSNDWSFELLTLDKRALPFVLKKKKLCDQGVIKI
jgi:hypothetical protein